MKCILFTALLVGFFSAYTQESDSSKKIDGMLGHLFIGPVFIQAKQIDNYMKQEGVLGAAYTPNLVGYTIGGEGLAKFNKFLIGAGGFAIIKPVSVTQIGTATTSISGGYIKLAYSFYNNRNTQIYLYTAFGGLSYEIEMNNLSDSMMLMFDHRSPITPGKRETYVIAGFLFDCGVGLKTFVFKGSDEEETLAGGMLLGTDLGCLITLPVNYWNSGKDGVSGPPGLPVMFCPYIRITFGGGGFRSDH